MQNGFAWIMLFCFDIHRCSVSGCQFCIQRIPNGSYFKFICTRDTLVPTRSNGGHGPLLGLLSKFSGGPKFPFHAEGWLGTASLLSEPLPALKCFSCCLMIIEHFVCSNSKWNGYISFPLLLACALLLHMWSAKPMLHHLCNVKLTICHVNWKVPHIYNFNSNVKSSFNNKVQSFFELIRR